MCHPRQESHHPEEGHSIGQKIERREILSVLSYFISHLYYLCLYISNVTIRKEDVDGKRKVDVVEDERNRIMDQRC